MLKFKIQCPLWAITVIASVLIMGCETVEQRYSPTALKQSVTHKDTSIQYRYGVLVMGMPRDQVIKAFGQPNGTDVKYNTTQDVYIFLKDGSKYVNPSPRARNVALAVVTMGTSVAVRQARLAYQRTDLTIYHVYYGPDQKIMRVEMEAGSAFKLPNKT